MSSQTGTMRGKQIAIYARYSSDKQSASSAQDQIERCLRLVQERGGEVPPQLRFMDAAVSGASLQRPGFERMMALARLRRINVLVVEDPDRLSRDMADSAFLFKEMQFYDVEVISASDGMSSFSPSAKTHFLLKGFMGEAYLDNLRDKTLRGLTARFQAGYATGAVAFGFRTDPKKNVVGEIVAHEISVDEKAAEIVRRIFREYLAGRSLALIASGLNTGGVVPPRSGKRSGTMAWSDSTVRAMLHNEAYAGTWKFAQRKWTKVPGTNIRRPKPRSASDQPMAQERPHLRIVNHETWSAVQERLAAVHQHYVRTSAEKTSTQGTATQFPFSGIVACDHCGSLMFISGRGESRRYRCSGNAKRGICTNRLTVLETVTRARLLEAISRTLLNDFGLAYARKVAASQVGERVRNGDRELKAKRAELSKTETRLRVLIEQLSDGDAADYLRQAMNDLATKARGLKAEIAGLESISTGPIELPSPETIRGWMKNLDGFVRRDPLAAREYFRKIFKGSKVRLRAQPDGTYMARTELLPMVLLTETPPSEESPRKASSSAHCGGRI